MSDATRRWDEQRRRSRRALLQNDPILGAFVIGLVMVIVILAMVSL